MAKILMIGCGALGLSLAKALLAEGHGVTAVKRHPSPVTDGIHYVAADITLPGSLRGLPTDFDCVFFILAPDQRDVASYNAIYQDGLAQVLAHFSQAAQQSPWFFVSSTSVYAQTNGEWVDECSAAEPLLPTARAIRGAEQRLQAASNEHCVVRFSGIYGPGRGYLLNLAQQVPAIQRDPPYYTNRIHADDCVAVLVFLLQQRLAGKVLANCYLASDDAPVTQWEVMTWLAEQLHCPPPTVKAVLAGADQNKRCNNQQLTALGYRFLYPSYREGYQALLGGGVMTGYAV